MGNYDFEDVMEELTMEWNENSDRFREDYGRRNGIRSTQIAALVSLLVRKGILKPEADA